MPAAAARPNVAVAQLGVALEHCTSSCTATVAGPQCGKSSTIAASAPPGVDGGPDRCRPVIFFRTQCDVGTASVLLRSPCPSVGAPLLPKFPRCRPAAASHQVLSSIPATFAVVAAACHLHPQAAVPPWLSRLSRADSSAHITRTRKEQEEPMLPIALATMLSLSPPPQPVPPPIVQSPRGGARQAYADF